MKSSWITCDGARGGSGDHTGAHAAAPPRRRLADGAERDPAAPDKAAAPTPARRDHVMSRAQRTRGRTGGRTDVTGARRSSRTGSACPPVRRKPGEYSRGRGACRFNGRQVPSWVRPDLRSGVCFAGRRRRSLRAQPSRRVLLHDPPLHGRQGRRLAALERRGGLVERQPGPGQDRPDNRRHIGPAHPGVTRIRHTQRLARARKVPDTFLASVGRIQQTGRAPSPIHATRTATKSYEDGIHHVFTRGDHKETIFDDDRDRRQFLQRYRDVVGRYEWIPLTHCLMGNHVHLVFETPACTLGDGCRDLFGDYARRRNWRREALGHVFGAGSSRGWPSSRAYFAQLLRYVALNPVKAGISPAAESWPWSADRGLLAGASGRPRPSRARQRPARVLGRRTCGALRRALQAGQRVRPAVRIRRPGDMATGARGPPRERRGTRARGSALTRLPACRNR